MFVRLNISKVFREKNAISIVVIDTKERFTAKAKETTKILNKRENVSIREPSVS